MNPHRQIPLLKQFNTEGTSAEMNVDRIIGELLTFLLRLSETYAYLYSLLLNRLYRFLVHNMVRYLHTGTRNQR